MEVRSLREGERSILAAAKEVFSYLHPELDLKDHRPRIAGIKNKIKAHMKNEKTDNLDVVVEHLKKAIAAGASRIDKKCLATSRKL